LIHPNPPYTSIIFVPGSSIEEEEEEEEEEEGIYQDDIPFPVC